MSFTVPLPSTHSDTEPPSDETEYNDPYVHGKRPLDRLSEFRKTIQIDSTLLSKDTPPSTYLGPSIRSLPNYAAYLDFPIHRDGSDTPFHGRDPADPSRPIPEYGDGLRLLKYWPSQTAWQQWARWHKYMKQFKADHWTSTGIYHLLEFSTRPYARHPEAIAAALHFWVRSTNCFFFRDRPMTPTLLDLKLMVDIPVTGFDLTPSRSYRDDYISASKLSSFGLFFQSYFVERDTGPTDSEYFAFLVYFLGQFVIYSAAKGLTKVLYPLAAALLEIETQVSLGPLLLGSLYRCLRHYTTDMTATVPVTGPIWILQIWLHMYMGHALCSSSFRPHYSSFWKDSSRVRRPLYTYFLDFVGLDFHTAFRYFYDDGQPCRDAQYTSLAFACLTSADWGNVLASRDLFVQIATSSKAEKGVELYSANMVAWQLGFRQSLPAPLIYSVNWRHPILFSRDLIADVDEITYILVDPVAVTHPSYGFSTDFLTWWRRIWHSFYTWPSASVVLASTGPSIPRGPAQGSEARSSPEKPAPAKRQALERPSTSRAFPQSHRPPGDTSQVIQSLARSDSIDTHRRVTRLVSRTLLDERRPKNSHDPPVSSLMDSEKHDGVSSPIMASVISEPIPILPPGTLNPSSTLIPTTAPSHDASVGEDSPSALVVTPSQEIPSAIPGSDDRPPTPPSVSLTPSVVVAPSLGETGSVSEPILDPPAGDPRVSSKDQLS